MQIGTLREFVVLALRLDYTAAARELHMSVSSLSRHISALETEMGFQLFNLNPVSLTAAGSMAFDRIARILDELDAVVEEGRALVAKASHNLRLYALPSNSAQIAIVYEAAAALHEKYPDFTLGVCGDDRYMETEEALIEGKADIGVLFRSFNDEGGRLDRVPIGEFPICAWVRKDNPAANLESATFADLASCVVPVSTNSQSRAATDSMLDAFRQNGVEVKTRLRDMENRFALYFSLGPDEVLFDFADDDEPARINKNLVKVAMVGDASLPPVYLAFSRGNSNPLIAEYLEVCQSLSAQKATTPTK